MKIFVAAAASGGAQEKGKTGWNSVYSTTKIGGKTSLGPSYFAFYTFHSQLHIWCPI